MQVSLEFIIHVKYRNDFFLQQGLFSSAVHRELAPLEILHSRTTGGGANNF